jgi:chromosome segregation ATPase
MSRRPSTAASPTKSPKKRGLGLMHANTIPTTLEFENMLTDQQHQLSM